MQLYNKSSPSRACTATPGTVLPCLCAFIPLSPGKIFFFSFKIYPKFMSIVKPTSKHSSQDLSFYLLESPGLSKLIPFFSETQRTMFFFNLPFVRTSDSNTLVPCIVYSHLKIWSCDCTFFHLS